MNLSAGVFTPILRKLSYNIKPFNMPISTNIQVSTIYYPYPLVGLIKQPKKKEHKGWKNKIKVKFEHGGDLTVYVDPYDHYRAAIEASARLDLSAISPDLGVIGITLLKNGWYAYSWAPFGLGCKQNALIPGRDFAHNHLPYGTQIIWGPDSDIHPYCREVMYCADKFGGPQPPNRIDLFAAVPKEFKWGKRRIRVKINKPNSKFSRLPIKGAQQAFNKLGIPGANGKKLKEDNDLGKETKYAFKYWLGINRNKFFWNIPTNLNLYEPEVYFQIRNI